MIGLLFILFLFAAIIFSMLGIGGGILFVPMLLQAGFDFHQAASIALAVMVVLSATAAAVYHFEKLVDWKIVLILEPFSFIGAYLAGYYSGLFPVWILKILLASIMLISAFLMLRAPKPQEPIKRGRPGFIHTKKGGDDYFINLWAGIPLTFIAGCLSALLGLGGGFAKVPMMTLIFRVPVKVAVATSSAMIVITALSGFMGHAAAGHVNYKLSAILAVAAGIGAFIGSKVSITAKKELLSRMFSIMLVILAAWMIYKAV